MKQLIIQIIFSFFLVLNSTLLLLGQEKMIEGMVTTFDSIPLMGASIEVKSTKELVFTDTLGMFAVACFPEDRLKVKARGFSGRKVKIKENIKFVLVNLQLRPGPENRELAIGYGHVKDADKLYAISNVNENDRDYCNRSIQLTYIPFSLDAIERRIASDMIVNMQLSNIYHEKIRIHSVDSTQLPFYGSPKKVYFTEKYIQLPNLEEFFYELVKEVRTIRIKKQTDLRLVGFSEYYDLNPLILLDNIPVSDVDEFLKIPLDRIEKVEIFDEPYIVTGRKYSGVICVSTKRKDFAGIKLNKNSLFFSYNLLSEGIFNVRDYGSLNPNKLTYRDNLLFWDPDYELNQDDPQTLSFYTSDSKGEYIVYIRSLNGRGKPRIYGTCKIVVE